MQTVNPAASGLEYPRFSLAEYADRYRRVRSLLEQKGLSALLVYGNAASQADLQYLAGFLARQDSYLVVPRDGVPSLHMQFFNHVPNAREYSVVDDLQWAGPDTAASVAHHLREVELGAAAIGIVGSAPFQHVQALLQALPEAQFCDATGVFRRMRLVKSPEEIEWARKGAALSDRGVEALRDGVRAGMREYEVGALVQSAYLHAGGQHQITYVATTSMHDPRRYVPAQTWSNRVVEPGDVILTEISAAYFGYAGQILRPFTVGEPPTSQYARLYELCEETYHRVRDTLRPGATAQDLLDVARLVDEAGYSLCDDLVHGYVGGYLAPVLRTPSTQHGLPVPDLTFQPGMMVVVQPNVITPDGTAGVQVGDLVLVTDEGNESLHRYPLEFGRCG